MHRKWTICAKLREIIAEKSDHKMEIDQPNFFLFANENSCQMILYSITFRYAILYPISVIIYYGYKNAEAIFSLKYNFISIFARFPAADAAQLLCYILFFFFLDLDMADSDMKWLIHGHEWYTRF